MALVSLSSKCFLAVETALEAVKTGDAPRSADILKSIKEDGSLLQQQALVFCDRLNKAEKEHIKQFEVLTKEMNELYQDEIQLKNRKQALERTKSSLTVEKEHCSRNRQNASRWYQEATKKKREAEEKREEFKNWWWVPIYGQVLAVRELIENNQQKGREAYKEMQRYESDMKRAESEIREANSAILQASEEQNQISMKMDNLRSQREECHNKLGDIKTLTSFIMQAVAFWEEVNMLTKAATVKTAQVQRIVNLAAEKNTVRILRSSGTQTKMRSFKECWMEVAETIASDKNNLVSIDKLCLSQRKTLYSTTRKENTLQYHSQGFVPTRKTAYNTTRKENTLQYHSQGFVPTRKTVYSTTRKENTLQYHSQGFVPTRKTVYNTTRKENTLQYHSQGFVPTRKTVYSTTRKENTLQYHSQGFVPTRKTVYNTTPKENTLQYHSQGFVPTRVCSNKENTLHER